MEQPKEGIPKKKQESQHQKKKPYSPVGKKKGLACCKVGIPVGPEAGEGVVTQLRRKTR